MWAVIKKEVRGYFLSPVGYVFIGALLLITSVFFYGSIFSNYSYGQLQYASLFGGMIQILTFVIALLTMGMFAGERKNGTDILLFTSSRSITSIVLGKFIAALIVIVITEIFSLVYYAILCIFAGGITNVIESLTAMLGFLLVAMTYISFGGFLSSMTENQIIAGISTIVLLIATWYLPNLSDLFSVLSPLYMFDDFPNGVISITDTLGLLSITLLFTLLTITVLQRKKSSK